MKAACVLAKTAVNSSVPQGKQTPVVPMAIPALDAFHSQEDGARKCCRGMHIDPSNVFLSRFPSRHVVYQVGTEGINSSLGRREELILCSSCSCAACPASLQLPSLGSK